MISHRDPSINQIFRDVVEVSSHSKVGQIMGRFLHFGRDEYFNCLLID